MSCLKKAKRDNYFIIRFPNGKEALVKCNGWAGLIPYTNYLKEEFEEDTFVIAISRLEALKFILKGKLFSC
jgi:hypothetical protein